MNDIEWIVVTSQGRRVLAVFGESLLSVAQDCARMVESQTGFPAFVERVSGLRPNIGQVLPPRVHCP